MQPLWTDRDFLMMQDIGEYGGLTASQLSTLHFRIDKQTGRPIPEEWKSDPHSNCQVRLKFLCDAELITHIVPPFIPSAGRPPWIHTLTPKGARALAAHLGCSVSELTWRRIKKGTTMDFLEHLMMLNDIRISFTYAARLSERDAHIALWLDDAQVRSKHTAFRTEEGAGIIPDGFFHLHVNRPSPVDLWAFAEADRGTEPVRTATERSSWEAKIQRYLEFFQSGLFTRHYGVPTARVLCVTSSFRRMSHLKAITEKAGGKSRFLFTTEDQIKPVLNEEGQTELHTILTKPIWEKAGKPGKHLFWLD